MYSDLSLLAGGLLVYAVVAGRVERSAVTGPIVFIAYGFLIGPLGLGWLSFEVDGTTLRLLAELTLALVLFNDAAMVDYRLLRSGSAIPARMLLIGLPLTLLAGFGAGVVLLEELVLVEVALLATILAPTDAALGQAVLKNEGVPADLRQGLNVESGLNDGICVPILFVLLALAATLTGAEASEHGDSEYLALLLFAEELGIGLAVGLVLAWVANLMLGAAREHDWLTPTWGQLPVIALALTSFAGAQALGGSGFIASFCGGLLFGYLMGDDREHLVNASEGIGDTFGLVTWVLFGAAVVGHSVANMTWPIAIYGLLSLTLLRMLPIVLSLTGAKVSAEGKWFLGWFGPRGLASIVFAVIVLHSQLPHGDVIATVVSFTVVASILLHGVSAGPWARRWARKA